MQKEAGVISIDATISLTLTIMIIMLLVDFGAIYQAQNYVYHGMLQTTKSMAVYSYYMERHADEKQVTNVENAFKTFFKVAGYLDQDKGRVAQSQIFWKESKVPELAELMYPVCTAHDKETLNANLKKYGIIAKSGGDEFDGIDFSKSKLDGKDIILDATFEVKMLWPVFGIEKIKLHQSTKARSWAKGA